MRSIEAQYNVAVWGSWEDTSTQFLSAVQLDYSTHFWRAMLGGASEGCEVSVGKGGWFDGCRNKAHSSGKLDEARFLGKMAKCEISETYANIDRTQL